jgi:hypothetical protein
MDARYTNPQAFTVLQIAKSITASEIPSAASTVTMEDPWPECFTPSRISAERAWCRSYLLRLGLSRFPLRLLFLFARVLFLALFLILLTAFVAHFIILCYCELSFRKIRSTRIMSPTGSVLSNRIQRLSWTSCERILSSYSAGTCNDIPANTLSRIPAIRYPVTTEITEASSSTVSRTNAVPLDPLNLTDNRFPIRWFS